MGPTWVLSAPDGPHVGPMNLAIRVGSLHNGTVMWTCHIIIMLCPLFVNMRNRFPYDFMVMLNSLSHWLVFTCELLTIGDALLFWKVGHEINDITLVILKLIILFFSEPLSHLPRRNKNFNHIEGSYRDFNSNWKYCVSHHVLDDKAILIEIMVWCWLSGKSWFQLMSIQWCSVWC